MCFFKWRWKFTLTNSQILSIFLWKHAQSFSSVWLFVTLWTIARQSPLSVGFSQQEYWSGLLYPLPGDLFDPRIEPVSCISCIGRQILYRWATEEAHVFSPWPTKVTFLPIFISLYSSVKSWSAFPEYTPSGRDWFTLELSSSFQSSWI